MLHLREWFHMFGEGWSLFKNPEGGSVLFGASFFSITGLHLMHVISGVIALMVIAIGYNPIGSTRITSKPPACTGTLSIWSGCSFFR